MDLIELKKSYSIQHVIDLVGVKPERETESHVYYLCPFHNDKNPSFIVDKNRGICACFSTACPNLGVMDHVKFVQNFFRLAKDQAVDKLYMLLDVDRPINTLHDVLARVMEKLNANIAQDRPKAFFDERGISEKTLNELMVGYSPSFDWFRGVIAEIAPDDAAKLEFYRTEMFNDAIVYANFDMLGRISGFRSRPFGPTGSKYLANNKGFPLTPAQLYGLHSVRGHQIILVEGPNDVLAMRSAGIHNTVGLMGNQVKRAEKYLTEIGFDDIIFVVDGEEAGKIAMITAPNLVRVVQVPDGLDPDEFLVKRGVLDMGELIQQAKFPFQLKIEAKTRKVKDTLDGKVMLVKSIARDLGEGLPVIVIGKIQEELSKILNIPVEDISSLFESVDFDTDKVERAIIWNIYSKTEIAESLKIDLHPNMFSNITHKKQFVELQKGLTPSEVPNRSDDLTENDVKWFIQMHQRRQLSRAFKTTSGQIKNLAQPIETTLAQLMNKMSDASPARTEVLNTIQQTTEALEFIKVRMKSPNKIMGISFGPGFEKTDQLLSGIRPGAVYVIAASTGVGKSNLTLDWGLNIAHVQKIPVLWLSLEMSSLEMTLRAKAKLTGIECNRIIKGDLSDQEFTQIEQESFNFGLSPFYLAPVGGINMPEMISMIHQYKVTKGIQVVFIDYLQLVHGEEGDNMFERVGAISRILKSEVAMSRSIGIPVVAVAQLQRQAAKADFPTAEHMSESYKISQDADAIITLQRRSKTAQTERPELGNIVMNVDKNRSGFSKQLIGLSFSEANLRFREVI